jgi:hypothetical protein
MFRGRLGRLLIKESRGPVGVAGRLNRVKSGLIGSLFAEIVRPLGSGGQRCSCGVWGDPRWNLSCRGLELVPRASDNRSREAICEAAGGYVREGKKVCFVGVGGKSDSLSG